jgi:hypothetical protein
MLDDTDMNSAIELFMHSANNKWKINVDELEAPVPNCTRDHICKYKAP